MAFTTTEVFALVPSPDAVRLSVPAILGVYRNVTLPVESVVNAFGLNPLARLDAIVSGALPIPFPDESAARTVNCDVVAPTCKEPAPVSEILVPVTGTTTLPFTVPALADTVMFLFDLSLPAVNFAVAVPVASVTPETNCIEPDEAEKVTVLPESPTLALFLTWAVITASEPAEGNVLVDVNTSTIAAVSAAI